MGSTNAKKLFRDERGLSTLEYAILLVLILVGSISLWQGLGTKLNSGLTEGTKKFGAAMDKAGASETTPPGQ